MDKLGDAPGPVADAPASLPPPLADAEALAGKPHGIPASVQALGYPPFPADDAVLFPGGETAGLARLEAQLARGTWCCKFEKARRGACAPPPRALLTQQSPCSR